MDIVARIKAISDVPLANIERKLNFGNGTIKRWNTSSPSIDKVVLVANFLNVSIDYLCTGKCVGVIGVELSQKQSDLLVFIKQNGITSVGTMPRDLLGEKSINSTEYPIVEYLRESGLIKEVPDIYVPASARVDGFCSYRISEKGVAYYENHIENNIGNNTSVRKQGIFGDGNNNNNVTVYGDNSVKLSEYEKELVRLYGVLDLRRKNALLNYAYELEKEMK
jgi:hypothetical protein